MEDELEGMVDREQWAAAIEENAIAGTRRPASTPSTTNTTTPHGTEGNASSSPFPPPVEGSEEPECKQN